jgi:hypothetical protein
LHGVCISNTFLPTTTTTGIKIASSKTLWFYQNSIPAQSPHEFNILSYKLHCTVVLDHELALPKYGIWQQHDL